MLDIAEFHDRSHSTNSAYGAVVSAAGRSAGGSSGGSAVVVATGQCHG
jgi:Asp-tRNA(Asn)/Glu-tRNA(Gln) amidotransferase A subunit family amidase